MSNDKIKMSLVAHIKDPEKRERVTSNYLGMKVTLDETLRRLIDNKLEKSYENMDDPKNYNSANLLPMLADQAGYRRALKELLALLP